MPLPAKQSVEVKVPVAAAGILFDDFSHTDQPSLINHGWTIRIEPGWSGVPIHR